MDVKKSPLSVTCPACNAAPFALCTAPTNTGRRAVQWVHNARTDLANEPKED